jgi:hypothetical protein
MSTYHDALSLHFLDKLIQEATNTTEDTSEDRQVSISNELQMYYKALCLIEDQALAKGKLSEEKFISVIGILNNLYMRTILGKIIANKLELVEKKKSDN